MPKVDPVTLEVVRNALIAICDEMSVTLTKTAYSPIVYEVRDYCTALVDPESRIIAQNTGGLPIFLADLGEAIRDGVRTYGKEGLHSGDAVIMNYPYICGQHLNNIVIYTPMIFEEELVCLPAVRAHWVDVGGNSTGFGSTHSTEIYQEGLQFRSLKLYEKEVPNKTLMQIIRDNLRFADSSLGDMTAQVTSCRFAERRLRELFMKYGKEMVLAVIENTWEISENLARARVRKMPEGTYEAESYLDNDGVSIDTIVPIKVKVIIEGTDITIDFSGLPDQVPGPINSATDACARVAFKYLTTPTEPVDEGCFRPLKVILPRGKILSAVAPAAMGGWSLPYQTIVDTIFKAVSNAIPDKIPAAHFGAFGNYVIYGVDKQGRNFICTSQVFGGWGGRPMEDGVSVAATNCQGLVQSASVELQELHYPILIESFALRQDSCGAGKSRGGLGAKVTIKCLQDAYLSVSIERTRCPPWGIQGGTDGLTNDAFIIRNSDRRQEKASKVDGRPLKSGDVLVVAMGGGGGWGNPLERPVDKVRLDVVRRYITVEAARKQYGVVIEPVTLKLNQSATAQARKMTSGS